MNSANGNEHKVFNGSQVPRLDHSLFRLNMDFSELLPSTRHATRVRPCKRPLGSLARMQAGAAPSSHPPPPPPVLRCWCLCRKNAWRGDEKTSSCPTLPPPPRPRPSSPCGGCLPVGCGLAMHFRAGQGGGCSLRGTLLPSPPSPAPPRVTPLLYRNATGNALHPERACQPVLSPPPARPPGRRPGRNQGRTLLAARRGAAGAAPP